VRVVVTVRGIQSADHVSVDRPNDALGGPVDSVCVERRLRVRNVEELPTVICASYAFAIEIVLSFSR